MVKAVVGANWGDEGKGKITDMLAKQADIIVRFQGGANARAHHSAIVPHDLAAKPALFQPCQTAQVYGGFCVAVSFQNTIFPC